MSYQSRHASSRRTFSSQRRNNNNRRSGRSFNRSRIDPKKYVNLEPQANSQVKYEATHTFDDFSLDQKILDNLAAAGFTNPTAIQDQSIRPILEGRDLVGLANTGTGKTAAFVLPIINKLANDKQRNHTLVITPTRELAKQVEDEFRKFSRGMGLYSAVCVGGMGIGRQIKELNRGVNIIIGTPGRLKDLAERNILKLDRIKTLILDEADQMLDMGFLPDMKAIISYLPHDRQILCFSATMENRVAKLIDEIQNQPLQVSVLMKQTAKHIHQDVVRSNDKAQKFEKLVELIEANDFEKVLVFGETKWGVQRLADTLSRRGFPSESIHGNKNQSQRQRSLNSFKHDKARVLVATDVAARGLDIPDVDLVVNFDEPNNHETYIHRIGRTGRAGKGGHARTFV